jgi:hypothetical protein
LITQNADRDFVASERQCTPAMSRPSATFQGELVELAAYGKNRIVVGQQ